MLWIDVEGFAYEVLEGSTNILSNISFLKVEVESKETWKGQQTADSVIKLLKEHNFVPLIRDFEYNTQYNIIFVPSIQYNYYEKIVRQVLAFL